MGFYTRRTRGNMDNQPSPAKRSKTELTQVLSNLDRTHEEVINTFHIHKTFYPRISHEDSVELVKKLTHSLMSLKDLQRGLLVSIFENDTSGLMLPLGITPDGQVKLSKAEMHGFPTLNLCYTGQESDGNKCGQQITFDRSKWVLMKTVAEAIHDQVKNSLLPVGSTISLPISGDLNAKIVHQRIVTKCCAAVYLEQHTDETKSHVRLTKEEWSDFYFIISKLNYMMIFPFVHTDDLAKEKHEPAFEQASALPSGTTGYFSAPIVTTSAAVKVEESEVKPELQNQPTVVYEPNVKLESQ